MNSSGEWRAEAATVHESAAPELSVVPPPDLAIYSRREWWANSDGDDLA